MTKNVTLRMDEDLLRRIRHRAVDEDLSLSAWITKRVAEMVSNTQATEDARERALGRLEHGYHLGGKPWSRDDLHAR